MSAGTPRNILTGLFFLALSLPVFPQALVSLPRAQEVSTASLSNGIDYFVVSNKVSAGFADFALVQKGTVPPEVTKTNLSELPHFQKQKPYQYLAKLGVGYEKRGFIRNDGASTTYLFENVPVNSQEVRDTILLMLFDIAGTYDYDQAIMISGDVDKSIIDRIKAFSMMVTPRKKLPDALPLPWKPNSSLRTEYQEIPVQPESRLSVSYSSPRTPKEAIGTVQALVTEQFAKELEEVYKARLMSAFQEKGLALADCSMKYCSSADGPGYESFTFDAVISGTELQASTSLMASVLSGLKKDGISEYEFHNAKDKVLSSISINGDLMTNSQWISRCSSSFLYGSHLSSDKNVNEFFLKRSLSDEMGANLFNVFLLSLLDKERGAVLKFECPSGAISLSQLKASWYNGWDKPSLTDKSKFSISSSDTLGLFKPKLKAKVKKTEASSIGQGELWTFSNGMKVYVKDTGKSGRFHYGLMVNGGFRTLSGLTSGEGGFVGDLLDLYDIGGLPGEYFKAMLSANGITMDPSVSAYDMRITGSAPSDRVQLLLKSILSVMYERNSNFDKYKSFRMGEKLRISKERKEERGIRNVIDSIMSPRYIYSEAKCAGSLSDELPARAEKLFQDSFSRCNDGILVFVGDIDLFNLKKVLPKYMGDFIVSSKTRNIVSGKRTIRSGWAEVPGNDRCITISCCAQTSCSGDRIAAFDLAMEELRKEINRTLSLTGMYAEIEHSASFFPTEELCFTVTCRPVDESGLPSGITAVEPMKTLGILRNVLSGFISKGPDGASLEDSKRYCISLSDASKDSPKAIVDAVMLRYSLGKTFTAYNDSINKQTSQSVKELMSAFEDGAKVEYLIY